MLFYCVALINQRRTDSPLIRRSHIFYLYLPPSLSFQYSSLRLSIITFFIQHHNLTSSNI